MFSRANLDAFGQGRVAYRARSSPLLSSSALGAVFQQIIGKRTVTMLILGSVIIARRSIAPHASRKMEKIWLPRARKFA